MGYLPPEGSSLAECQEAYDRHYNSGGVSYKRREQQAIVNGFVSAAEWSPGMRILDVGCGIGFHAHLLSRKGFRVTGIDFSKAAIALAAKRPGPNYILQNATSYSPKEKFDGILFNDFSLFHYELSGVSHLGVDMDAFIWRIFSWLAPGGSILIKAPTNVPGIDKNSVVDFASALHSHAGPLTHSTDAHTILITAKSRDAAPVQPPEQPPELTPDDDQLAPGNPLGYPDPWGYGHKS
jgi:2-polyprenyl-3-methyl-5-hydroxy-6-metoxy-1,4-benzoquinol methylase